MNCLKFLIFKLIVQGLWSFSAICWKLKSFPVHAWWTWILWFKYISAISLAQLKQKRTTSWLKYLLLRQYLKETGCSWCPENVIRIMSRGATRSAMRRQRSFINCTFFFFFSSSFFLLYSRLSKYVNRICAFVINFDDSRQDIFYVPVQKK